MGKVAASGATRGCFCVVWTESAGAVIRLRWMVGNARSPCNNVCFGNVGPAPPNRTTRGHAEGGPTLPLIASECGRISGRRAWEVTELLAHLWGLLGASLSMKEGEALLLLHLDCGGERLSVPGPLGDPTALPLLVLDLSLRRGSSFFTLALDLGLAMSPVMGVMGAVETVGATHGVDGGVGGNALHQGARGFSLRRGQISQAMAGGGVGLALPGAVTVGEDTRGCRTLCGPTHFKPKFEPKICHNGTTRSICVGPLG
jgi:hypothetical protein